MEIKYIHSEEVHNTVAAANVLPLVCRFIKPNSVLDVGCGIGTWLSVARSFGVETVFGIDGDYVDKRLLTEHVAKNEFLSHDLNAPFDLGRKFDLAICLEVAEHLPESSSETLVASLVRHSGIILFSAAIPGQGGQNHLNEQWPEYWAKKFAGFEYVFLDIIRPLIWDDPKVDFWYKQNIFLVVKSSHELAKKYPHSNSSLVHPQLYQAKNKIFDKKINSLQSQLEVHPLKRWIKNLISFK